MWGLIVLLLLGTVSGGLSAKCSKATLQDDVQFNKIAGTWGQIYYSIGSVYADATCIESRIFGVNTERQEFSMESKAVVSLGATRTPTIHTMLSAANWGKKDIPRETNVKDHMASDYTTYLLFYSCNDGKASVSVELKDGLTRLPLNKIKEVSSVLSKVGINFFELVERAEPGCPKK